MGNFNLKTDASKKVLHIELEGSFSQEDGLRSISAYQDTIASINTKEYSLDIDCKKLNVTAPEIVPLLEGCLTMFKKDEFQKVVLTLENNAILKMQLARLGRSVGLDNLEIISA
ncbi:hypothetical protein HNR77_000059 [Paenibacillus sp. JGP012]|jgi:hypothetical protein|uniref:STAS domain-containing protein n=1 Tax=Paenibacillus silvae TaxID=1325358 RepID=A0ABQ1ZC73_9BACL|nr:MULTISPECIES: hypothetical protein [Paenibacillus]MBB6019002.1 hypothetical protein [Paenibacillus sp. JGP012]MBU5356171.1 hypothetical protein [Paenibacillus barcinonensis]MCK6074370.1 hypothetical protein [Paenibacillus silvae]MCK6148152.1 hypothetical protein [Paenibacillus silvae]MCK6266452.1 hypothetical protein [Paenibacillus silvae]